MSIRISMYDHSTEHNATLKSSVTTVKAESCINSQRTVNNHILHCNLTSTEATVRDMMQMTMRAQEPSHTHTHLSTWWWANQPYSHSSTIIMSCFDLRQRCIYQSRESELPNESVMSADEDDESWSSVMENPNHAWRTSSSCRLHLVCVHFPDRQRIPWVAILAQALISLSHC